MVSAAVPRPTAATEPKRITVLGATGSIGASTLSVVADLPGAFAIEAVTANSSGAELARIARASGARLAVVADPAAYADLKAGLAGTGIAAAAGEAALIEAAVRPVDMVVAAIVGAAGLAPTYAALAAGTPLALANKECMVSAGDLFMATARRANVQILPVDSEHNAIFALLAGRSRSEVDRITITASGGPFRNWPLERMAAATTAEALRHPNWSMGRKISIDSATMMNKGLELIEAHHMFGLPSARLDVLVHPQSIVHAMISAHDGYVLACLSLPDMRTAIARCLAWPDGSARAAERPLDLAAIGSLEFSAPDLVRFPALRLAREALDMGGWATNILNAANEIAVEAFLAGRIRFLEIARIVEDTVNRASAKRQGVPASIDEAVALDREARRIAGERIASATAPSQGPSKG
jgi:1-deoxy-D-xylulose-5-phosphate reductoisomerase